MNNTYIKFMRDKDLGGSILVLIIKPLIKELRPLVISDMEFFFMCYQLKN